MEHKVLPGTAILIWKEERLLLGLRRTSHGNQTWAAPGGHIDFGEDPVQAVTRETLEETGITIEHPKFKTITNDVFKETGKHYVTLWYEAFTADEPKVTSPREIDSWQWFTRDHLPEPLFLPLKNLVDKTKL